MPAFLHLSKSIIEIYAACFGSEIQKDRTIFHE